MDMKNGSTLIEEERKRQIEKEGWSPEHDDKHIHGELVMVAICYLLNVAFSFNPIQSKPDIWWPVNWDKKWWKPKSHLSNLVKAGALIAAEIDRLQREKEIL